MPIKTFWASDAFGKREMTGNGGPKITCSPCASPSNWVSSDGLPSLNFQIPSIGPNVKEGGYSLDPSEFSPDLLMKDLPNPDDLGEPAIITLPSDGKEHPDSTLMNSIESVFVYRFRLIDIVHDHILTKDLEWRVRIGPSLNELAIVAAVQREIEFVFFHVNGVFVRK